MIESVLKKMRVLSKRSYAISVLLLRDLQNGQLSLRASGLVFTTLLSLVPLLAFSFSVLKGFGVHNQIEPLLLQLLEPLGDQRIVITQQVVGFVENMKVGVLGAFGFMALIYTLVTLTRKIEDAFNYTWRVGSQRRLIERFSHYLSILVVGPMLMFSAIGLTASIFKTDFIVTLSHITPFGHVVSILTLFAPKLLIIIAFAFAYWFIPNTRVKFKAAIIGGIIAGLLWHFSGWAFATYVANSSQQVQIYSVFASLFFFFIWLYLGWMILLIGSSLAYYIQHPKAIERLSPSIQLSIKDQESLAINLMVVIGERQKQRLSPFTLDELKQELQIPRHYIEAALADLIQHDFVTMDYHAPSRYVPIRALNDLSVQEVLETLRSGTQEQIELTHSFKRTLVDYRNQADKSIEDLSKAT